MYIYIYSYMQYPYIERNEHPMDTSYFWCVTKVKWAPGL